MPRPGAPSLRGQVVFVTGAASGLGAATALELQGRGAQVVLVDCDAQGLADTAKVLGGDPLALTADISVLADCEAAVAQALTRHGRIDIVWANAGIASFGPLAYTDPLAFRRCIEVNVIGTFHTVRAALPAVRASRGYIAVSASLTSFAHPPAMSAYAASKAAIEAMSTAWRIELAAHEVGVGVIYAAAVNTPLMTEGALHPSFIRLQQATPAPLRAALSAAEAAVMIADGLQARRRQIWVPGWVRVMFWLRALLHTRLAERELLRAAPEIEAHYIEGMSAVGSLAFSLGPREHARVSASQRQVNDKK